MYNFSPETGNAVILIGEGQYFEMLSVARSAPLTLLASLSTPCNIIVEAKTLLRVSWILTPPLSETGTLPSVTLCTFGTTYMPGRLA